MWPAWYIFLKCKNHKLRGTVTTLNVFHFQIPYQKGNNIYNWAPITVSSGSVPSQTISTTTKRHLITQNLFFCSWPSYKWNLHIVCVFFCIWLLLLQNMLLGLSAVLFPCYIIFYMWIYHLFYSTADGYLSYLLWSLNYYKYSCCEYSFKCLFGTINNHFYQVLILLSLASWNGSFLTTWFKQCLYSNWKKVSLDSTSLQYRGAW